MIERDCSGDLGSERGDKHGRWALRWRPGLDLLIVAALAFAVRVLHAVFLSRTPFLEGPTIDSATYWGIAQRAASTGDFGGAFYQPPLYPAFLALLFRLGLTSVWAVEIVQTALGAATAAMMVVIGRRLAGAGHHARYVGLTAGLVTAFYGPLVLFDVELLPPALVNFLLASALLLALRATRVGLQDAAMGLFTGMAVTGWPLVFAFIPGLLALRVKRLATGRSRALCAALVLACALPPIALTARHNAAHGGAGVLVSYNTGINLWLGNNPNWRDTWRARPGASFEMELERPDRAGFTKPAPKAAYFVRQVGRDVVQRPLAALGRTLEKFYYMWHGREIRRNQDIELLREGSPLLRALIWEAGLCFPFGLVAPLALLALVRRRREADVSIIGMTAVFYGLIVAIFFVAERYRLPIALLVIPLAVDQAFYLARAASARGLVAVGLGVVALNLPIAFTRTFAADDAERGILTARALRFQGRVERADAVSEALVGRFPEDPNVQMLRAELLLATKGCKSALPHLEATVKLAPQTTTPRGMLAGCHDALGDEGAAYRAFAALLAVHPFHRDALKSVGRIYARHGRVSDALRVLKRFVGSGYEDQQVNDWVKQLERMN